jgi:hypothetical protein
MKKLEQAKPNPSRDSDYLKDFTPEHLTKLRLNIRFSIRNLQNYLGEIDMEIARRDNEALPKLFDVEGK